MTNKLIEEKHHQTFESLRQKDDEREFWSGRALVKILEYNDYRNFINVVEKAKLACRHSGNDIQNHFVEVTEMVPIGSGAKRPLQDVRLSRYACYLIVQNGDPTKPVVANGQTYFAVQTRKQELIEGVTFQKLREGEKRILLRQELREHNKQLVETAQHAGVETTLDFAIFQNHGYKGLYGGMDAKKIHQHKGLKKSQKFWTIWEVQSSQQTFSVQHKLKKNFDEKK